MKCATLGAACFLIALGCVESDPSGRASVASFALLDEPRHWLVRLDEPEEAIRLRDEGINIIRRIAPARLGGDPRWYLAFLTDRAARELETRELPLFPADDVSVRSTFGDAATEGPALFLSECGYSPAAGTFCPYATTSARCPTPILSELYAAPSTYPPVEGRTYVQVFDIFSTVEGRPITAVRVGRLWGQGDPLIPQLLVVAGQHANEWAAPEMAMRLFRYYAQGYRDDLPGIRALLQDRAIVIVPVANPDGYDYTFGAVPGQRDWRKNRRPCGGSIPGVDPNRNFPFTFGQPGADPSCGDANYRGPSASSEWETMAARYAVSAYGGPGYYRTGFVLSLHTYGDFVFLADGISSGSPPSPCTTDSNCSQADLGAFLALTGSEVSPRLYDEQSGAPYVVGASFRQDRPLSGDLVKDVVSGVLLGGAPKVAAATAELTMSDCGHYTEQLGETRIAALFTRIREYAGQLLGDTKALAEGTWWAANTGNFVLPHLHRRMWTAEVPTVRVAALKSLGTLTFTPQGGYLGTGGLDSVVDGVAYRSWKWTPATPWYYPNTTKVCAGGACAFFVIEDNAVSQFNLCDAANYPTRNGWTWIGDQPGSLVKECYWDFTGAGSGPWVLTSRTHALGGTHDLKLIFTHFWQNGYYLVNWDVTVSSNGFVGCSKSGFGTCRVLREYPYPANLDGRTALTSRTEVVDISDFDGQSNVQVRLRVNSRYLSANQLDIFDPVIVGWRD